MFVSNRGFGVGVLAWLAAVSAVSVLACGTDSETASTTAVKAPEVGETAMPPELPPEFPSDIPTYPGAVLIQGGSASIVTLASFETPDDPETVAERLKRDFISDGWSAEVSMRDPSKMVTHPERGIVAGSVTAEKQGREVIVTLSVKSGTTRADFFVSKGG